MQQPRTLSSSSYGLLGSYAVSAEQYGVTLKDRNLNAEHLEQSHTHSFDQHLHRQNHVVASELPVPSGNAYVSATSACLRTGSNIPRRMSALLAMFEGRR